MNKDKKDQTASRRGRNRFVNEPTTDSSNGLFAKRVQTDLFRRAGEPQSPMRRSEAVPRNRPVSAISPRSPRNQPPRTSRMKKFRLS